MKTILKFVIAGGLGFIVDFTLLNLMLWLSLGPIISRVVSFSIAVLATFIINRRFTFQSNSNVLFQFKNYIIGSLFGFCFNWAIYTISLIYTSPQLSLILSSGFAMTVNFSIYRFLVFKPK